MAPSFWMRFWSLPLTSRKDWFYVKEGTKIGFVLKFCKTFLSRGSSRKITRSGKGFLQGWPTVWKFGRSQIGGNVKERITTNEGEMWWPMGYLLKGRCEDSRPQTTGHMWCNVPVPMLGCCFPMDAQSYGKLLTRPSYFLSSLTRVYRERIEIHVSSLVTKIYFYWPLCLVWLASNNPHRTIIVFLQVFPKAGFSVTSSWSVFEIWTAFVHGRSPVMPKQPAPCILRQVSSWQHTESLTWLSPWLRNVPLVTEETGKGQHAQMTTHDNHSFVHRFPKKLKSFGFRVMELSVGWKPVYSSGDSVANEF